MKKDIFKKIFISALAVVLGLTVFGCKKTPKEEDTTVTETTTETVTVTNEDGETVIVPPEMFNSETPTNVPIAEEGKAGSLDDKAIEKMSEYVPPKTVTQPSGETARLLDSYRELINGNKYLIKLSAVEGEEKISIVYTKSDSKKYGQIESSEFSFAYLDMGDGRAYMLSPENKTYTLLVSEFKDEMGSLFSEVESLVEAIVNAEDYKYEKTEKVKKDGKTLTCEVYSNETETLNFYFDGTKLVKIGSVYDGTETAFDVEKITPEADENIFKIPTGYIYLGMLTFFSQFAEDTSF